jgi:heparan-alpha-glucosaminide N-acetyltransferase
MNQLPRRLLSINVFRAITMFLMIFVNDLWTLKGIPAWLEHTKAAEDGMGLADTIFPAFLFIVGLSIPFALLARQSKGASQKENLVYVCTRSLALLLMGFFHINLENYNGSEAILPEPVWEILITVGFFLIWLDYPASMQKRKRILLQGIGVLILIAMALLYKGGTPEHTTWMRPYWWGILGLIGWSYLLCACIFLFSKGKLSLLVGALIFFLLFNIGTDAGWLGFLHNVKKYVWIVGDGSMPALTMAGVVTAMVYRKFFDKEKLNLLWIVLAGMALFMFIIGFALRPYWGISKIRATPSWVMICSGISIVFFALLIWFVDIKKKQKWFEIIKPAGTSTLTCYLLPYIHYAIFELVGVSLPLVLRTGIIGIIKSLFYALIIILVAGILEKRRIRLKV